MEKYAIIVAGGIGARMKSEVPKQFLLVDGEPIIVKSIRKFIEYDESISVIIVLPEDHFNQWNEIKAQYFSDKDFVAAVGGSTRTASVMSGLEHVEDGLVAIHDAVRPFVSVQSIADSFQSAETYGSGVVAVQLKDSIREIDGDVSAARDRSNYVLVQTPQTFNVESLKSAYKQVTDQQFTDDASVYEAAGHRVYLVEGSYDNIKITTPEDLK